MCDTRLVGASCLSARTRFDFASVVALAGLQCSISDSFQRWIYYMLKVQWPMFLAWTIVMICLPFCNCSESYNFSTALRQSALQPFASELMYIPMAFFFPLEVFTFHKAWNTLYQVSDFNCALLCACLFKYELLCEPREAFHCKVNCVCYYMTASFDHAKQPMQHTCLDERAKCCYLVRVNTCLLTVAVLGAYDCHPALGTAGIRACDTKVRHLFANLVNCQLM